MVLLVQISARFLLPTCKVDFVLAAICIFPKLALLVCFPASTSDPIDMLLTADPALTLNLLGSDASSVSPNDLPHCQNGLVDALSHVLLIEVLIGIQLD